MSGFIRCKTCGRHGKIDEKHIPVCCPICGATSKPIEEDVTLLKSILNILSGYKNSEEWYMVCDALGFVKGEQLGWAKERFNF